MSLPNDEIRRDIVTWCVTDIYVNVNKSMELRLFLLIRSFSFKFYD